MVAKSCFSLGPRVRGYEPSIEKSLFVMFPNRNKPQAWMLDFGKTRLSIARPISSYSKIQRVYSALFRNSGLQAGKANAKATGLLNLGCGDQIHPSFVNLDYNWIPGVDLCWDLAKSLPFPDHSIEGVFSEHCLGACRA